MRKLVVATVWLAGAWLAAGAQALEPHKIVHAAAPGASWLAIQNAASMTFDGKTLTLQGVSPTVVAFTDRPKRMATEVPLDLVLQGWDKRKDNGKKDPPNAGVSVVREGAIQTVVVVLTNPRRSGDSLRYDVRMLEGTLPPSGGPTSIFIDNACFSCWSPD
jgi:hypothetical protein